MQFTIPRESILRPLQQVISVVERRNTMPVLSNILIDVSSERLTITGSDMEVELCASTPIMAADHGAITVPARKFFDIIKSLPDGVDVQCRMIGDRMQVKAGRSKFTLTSLPAADFPSVEDSEVQFRVTVQQSVLKSLLQQTMFAMAVQDVRYYLNGLLLESRPDGLRVVATDGHRMAIVDSVDGLHGPAERQVIIPRKGVAELFRLLDVSDRSVDLELHRSHLRAVIGNASFSSKIIDGRYPDYEAVVPVGADQLVKVNREDLCSALQRAAILSNAKYRGVRIDVSQSALRVTAHNPEQEEATEEVTAETEIEKLSVCFNVDYVLEAISEIESSDVVICLKDGNSSGLIKSSSCDSARYVVMPLRL